MDLLNKAYDPELFRKSGHELVDLIADYLNDSMLNEKGKVIDWKEPEEEYKYWENYLEKNASTKDFFKDIIQHAIHLHHPKYLGHQVSAPVPISALAGLLSSVLNNGMAVYEMGPAANALERWIVKQFVQKLGFDENAYGLLTSGGTLATLTALLTARQIMSENDIWQNGHQEKLAIIITDEAHYAVDRAARIMGLGDSSIIKVPVDEDFKMKTSVLENYYEQAQKDGLKVFAIVGNSCSTATGTYDNLNEIADFCEKQKVWFHADAAHGGGAIFSSKYKHLLDGINKADSVVIDLHKMLMNPALSTLVMYKNGQDSYQTFSQKAQYLWEKAEDHEWYNSGKRTFECTKLMMSMKFYAIVNAYGFEIFDQNVTYLYDLAREFAEQIKKRENFEQVIEPNSNILCFRYINSSENSNLNELNSQIRKKLLENGEYYIVQTTISDNIYLRTTLMNPKTSKVHLTELLDEIEKIAMEVKNE
jgi:L-2,4-diaminobutyrate decarboxylase